MQSTLKNMVLVLFVITLVASAAVGGIFKITEEPIAQAKAAKTKAALAAVLPAFDNDPGQEVVSTEVDGLSVLVYKATVGGQLAGYAVETQTNNGFNGKVKLMVGFDAENQIVNISVLEHTETPGLGSKMTDEGNKLIVSFQGKNPADLKLAVKKDGGDIDALTAATISSRAYVDAVERGYKALLSVTSQQEAPAATITTTEPAGQEGGDNE